MLSALRGGLTQSGGNSAGRRRKGFLEVTLRKKMTISNRKMSSSFILSNKKINISGRQG